MTHVRAVGQIVRAELAHEELIKKSRLVTRASRSVESGFVRRRERVQLSGYHLQILVLPYLFVMSLAAPQDDRVCEATLLVEPVVGFPRKVCDRQFLEK